MPRSSMASMKKSSGKIVPDELQNIPLSKEFKTRLLKNRIVPYSGATTTN